MNAAEFAAGIGSVVNDVLNLANKGRNPFKSSIAQVEDSAAYNPIAKNLMDDIGRFGDDVGNAGKEIGTGSVATRINIKTGDNKGGLTHALNNHGSDMSKTNKSQFTISDNEVVKLLKDKDTIKTPAYKDPETGNYVRKVDTGRNIGVDAKNGNVSTTILTVITDKKGNLITAFPGVLK